MTKWILFAVFSLSLTTLVSCNSADEQDDLAKAQKCLDEVAQTAPQSALDCLQPIEKYTSQQANIIKCAIYVTSGGLMENRVLAAYKALKDDTITNKEAAFMAVLSLDTPTLTAGLATAKTANTFCAATGVPGLEYLSNIIVAGTSLNKTIQDIGGSVINASSSPTDIKNAVQNLLATCDGDSAPTAGCDTNLVDLGTAVAALSTSYCSNKNSADDDVCKKINDATVAAGSNATHLGQAVICYMNNKTFVAARDPQCQ